MMAYKFLKASHFLLYPIWFSISVDEIFLDKSNPEGFACGYDPDVYPNYFLLSYLKKLGRLIYYKLH